MKNNKPKKKSTDVKKSFIVKCKKTEIIDTFSRSCDGGKTWEQKPGNLGIKLYFGDSTFNNTESRQEIGVAFREGFALEKIKKDPVFTDTIFNCKHKIYAVYYHLSLVENEIKKQVEKYSNGEYVPTAGVQEEKLNYVLVYETEAFLFQIKSNLDVAIRLLEHFFVDVKFHHFKSSGSGKDKKAGGGTVRKLRNIGDADIANFIEREVVDWIQEVVDWRDEVTHYSALKKFMCFNQKLYREEGKVEIVYPQMPSGERLDLYCKETYKKLLRFYQKLFVLLNNKSDE